MGSTTDDDTVCLFWSRASLSLLEAIRLGLQEGEVGEVRRSVCVCKQDSMTCSVENSLRKHHQ